MEEWKDIKGFEGLYQVSTLGRVRSLDRYVNNIHGKRLVKGCLIKPILKTNGYLQVSLSNGSVIVSAQIHRLVAEAFIPNPDNLPYINHKSEDKTENTVENLEWCTAKYNINYGTCIERQVSKRSKPVLMFAQDGSFVREFKSVNEAGEKLGIWPADISNICNNKNRNKNINYDFRFK